MSKSLLKSTKQALKKDARFIFYTYIAVTVSLLISKGSSYIWTYILAKQGPLFLGEFSVIMSIISMYSMLTSLWLVKQGGRHIIFYREKHGEKIGNLIVHIIFYTTLLSNFLFFGIFLIAQNYISYTYKHLLLVAFTIFIFINPLRIFVSYLTTKRKIMLAALTKSSLSAFIKISALIIFFYYLKKDPLIGALIAYLLGESIPLIFLFIYTTMRYKLHIPLPTSIFKKITLAKEILLLSLPLGISQFFAMFSKNAIIFIITYFKGAAYAGIYAISNPFISLLEMIFTPLYHPLSIVINERMNQHKKEEIKILLFYTIKYTLIIFFFIYTILVLFGKEILSGIFGKEYEKAYFVLLILLPAKIIMLIGSLYFRVTWSQKKVNYVIKLHSLSTATVFLCGSILVWLIGIEGGALTVLLSSLIISTYHIKKAKKILYVSIPLKETLSAFILSLLSLKSIFYLAHLYIKYLTVLQALFMLTVSGVVYLVLLFITKTITYEEIKKIYHFLFHN